MSKVTGGLLSFGASGQIGKTMVYSTWRGIPYARRHVVPANPRSTQQTKTRSVFTFLSALWKLAPAEAQAPWTLFAQGQPLTDRNAFIGQNVKALRAGTDMSAVVGSPGAKGGLSAASISVSGGSGSLAVTLGAPTLPDGWAIVEAVAIAVPAGDPHTATNHAMYVSTDTSSPYVPTLSGIPAGTYEVSAWFKFTKADGSTAYGPSINHTGTAS